MDDLFTELYENYYDDVYRLIYSYTFSIQDTEDILQKVFTKLYKHIIKFNKGDVGVKKWLFKVAINEVLDFFKSSWKRKKIDYENIENIASKDNINENDMLLMLKSIAKEYRIPIYLYYYEGYGIEEIAKIMHKSETCIKTRLKRGREKLKREMER